MNKDIETCSEMLERRQYAFRLAIRSGNVSSSDFFVRYMVLWSYRERGRVRISCEGFCPQSSMEDDSDISPPIHTIDLVTPSMSVSDPQKQCDELIHNEHVDKDTAIRIYKLYTTMVSAHHNCESQKKHELACLQHEISILNLSSQGKENMDGLIQRLNTVDARFDKIEKDISNYTRSLQDLQTQLFGIETRLTTTKKR